MPSQDRESQYRERRCSDRDNLTSRDTRAKTVQTKRSDSAHRGSISVKDFCMANEPERPHRRADDDSRSSTTQVGNLSSSRSSGSNLKRKLNTDDQKAVSIRKRHHAVPQKGGSSANVLNSILGSTTALQRSASRAKDRTGFR